MNAASGIEALQTRHPEWRPWLVIVADVVEQLRHAAWSGCAARVQPERRADAPLLAAAQLEVDGAAAEALYAKMLDGAVRSGAPSFAALEVVPRSERGALAALAAAVNGDDRALGELAAHADVDADVFRAVAALLPLPLLHACRARRDAAPREDWAEGYCPVCGAWPSFAEVRGVERSRYLRCGACGCAWASAFLKCAYCGTTDHNVLETLVAEGSGAKASLEVCNACTGYLKSFTLLQGVAAEEVMVRDLATVELDIAAAARGYRRPPGRGYALGVTLCANGVSRAAS